MPHTNNQLQCGFNDQDPKHFEIATNSGVECPGCGRWIEQSGGEEAQWICRVAKNNDHEAFAKLMDRYADLVYRIIKNKTHADHDTIEDYRQEVVLRIFKNAEQFKCWKHPRPWIIVITVNFIRSQARYWGRRPRHLTTSFGASSADDSGAPNPLEPFEEYEDAIVSEDVLEAQRRQLNRAINKLPEALQAVIQLHFAELSNPDIAEILDISISNVGQRLHQAKKTIRDSI